MKIDTIFNQQKVFVTGTDTEVGKTYVSALIINYFNNIGIKIKPLKPISAGTQPHPDFEHLVNEDALTLWQAANQCYPIKQINPIMFDPPIAPHIAANMVGYQLSKAKLNTVLLETHNNVQPLLIEGAGGWMLPLNNDELMSDWVIENDMPVILVVGIKLGCLNHSLLTASSILNSGGKLVGWVANFIEGDSEVAQQNVEYLTQWLKKHNVELLFSVQKGQTQI